MTLYIFDKDGTLVAEVFGRPPLTREQQVLIPGVKEKIQELRRQGHLVCVASNQGAVAKGLIPEYRVYLLMMDLAEKLEGFDLYRYCPHHPDAGDECECRKPKPKMIFDLMEACKTPPEETFMVGNSEVDRLAAEAAGVEFVWAKDFFERY